MTARMTGFIVFVVLYHLYRGTVILNSILAMGFVQVTWQYIKVILHYASK